jgi:outer membrane murein-binding lipoprotein Lpp
MHHLVRVTACVIVATLLLAAVASCAQARQARPGQIRPVSTGDAERAEDAPWICLALVLGTALLAGGVWMRKLRRMLS